MKNEKWTYAKRSLIEVWRHAVVMKRGWRVGIMVASAVLLLMGCTPRW